jgi:hypothetical protein
MHQSSAWRDEINETSRGSGFRYARPGYVIAGPDVTMTVTSISSLKRLGVEDGRVKSGQLTVVYNVAEVKFCICMACSRARNELAKEGRL